MAPGSALSRQQQSPLAESWAATDQVRWTTVRGRAATEPARGERDDGS
jgi:hypothetical protein